MDRPICRVCGAKHYASEPHTFNGVMAPIESGYRGRSNVTMPCPTCKAKDKQIEALKARIEAFEVSEEARKLRTRKAVAAHRARKAQ